MLKIIKKENITQNGKISTQIKGKIIKFYFYNENPNVMLQIETEDKEVLFQGSLDQKHMNIYPRKSIQILDINILEHYYMFPNDLESNNLFIRITGLEEGQKINMVKVLYDDKQQIKVTD